MGILSTYYLYLTKSNYNTTKKTINGRSHIQYTQVSYTKVSRIIRLTHGVSVKHFERIPGGHTIDRFSHYEKPKNTLSLR